MKAKILSAALGALMLSACGGPDNVGACKRWLSSASCGNTDFSTMVNCEVYKDTSCDIAPYFDCLTANTKCQNGTADTSGWTQCASKAQCR